MREGEVAWQVGLEGEVFAASSYKQSITLEDFAKHTAETNAILEKRIEDGEILTTITSTFVPDNEYIDEPVSSLTNLLLFGRPTARL